MENTPSRLISYNTPFCITACTALTWTAKPISNSRDEIAVEYGVYLLMRGIGNTLAHLLHDQRPFRKQTKVLGWYLLTDFPGRLTSSGRQNKCLGFNPTLEHIKNLFPIPSVFSPPTQVQRQHKLVLVLKEQRHTRESTSGWSLLNSLPGRLWVMSCSSASCPPHPTTPSHSLYLCTQLKAMQLLLFLQFSFCNVLHQSLVYE